MNRSLKHIVSALTLAFLLYPTTTEATVVISATAPSASVENVNFTPSAPDASSQTGEVGNSGFFFTAMSDETLDVQGATTLKGASGNTTVSPFPTGGTKILGNSYSLFPADFFGVGGCSSGASCPIVLSVNLGILHKTDGTSVNGISTAGGEELSVTVVGVDSGGTPFMVSKDLNQEGENPARFSIQVTMGEIVTGLTATGKNDYFLVESKQIRVDPAFLIVPEPNSFVAVLFAMTLTGAGCYSRRRTKRRERAFAEK